MQKQTWFSAGGAFTPDAPPPGYGPVVTPQRLNIYMHSCIHVCAAHLCSIHTLKEWVSESNFSYHSTIRKVVQLVCCIFHTPYHAWRLICERVSYLRNPSSLVTSTHVLYLWGYISDWHWCVFGSSALFKLLCATRLSHGPRSTVVCALVFRIIPINYLICGRPLLWKIILTLLNFYRQEL